MNRVTWADVIDSYHPGDSLRPLVGGSTLLVEAVDETELWIRQRLWRACLTPAALETANEVLAGSGPVNALEFGELLRAHYASGPRPVTDCSRVPNLTAVLLMNMGVLTVDRAAAR